MLLLLLLVGATGVAVTVVAHGTVILLISSCSGRCFVAVACCLVAAVATAVVHFFFLWCWSRFCTHTLSSLPPFPSPSSRLHFFRSFRWTRLLASGLVTLFLDKEREYLCWCPPGAAELVPDERYRIDVRLLEEVRG